MLPRTAIHYPSNLEREYTRITNEYMAILNQCLAKHLPTLRQAMTAARVGMRHDDFNEFGEIFYSINDVIIYVFGNVQRDFERRAVTFNLKNKLTQIATQSRNWSVNQWRRVVHDTFGINILEDYYLGEFFRLSLARWVDTNVALIKSVPQQTIIGLRNIVQDSWQRGLLNNDIARRIQAAYNVSERKARFWARDQMASLNANLAQQQQRDAGVEEYIWSTSGDERVRGNPSGIWPKGEHYFLDGKRYKWNNPPVVDKKKGRTAHPGEDYQCRCVALPVFNLPGLSLPWEKGEQT